MSTEPNTPDTGDPRLLRVAVDICENCRNGVPGTCHVPGCLFCRYAIEDTPQPMRYRSQVLAEVTPAEGARASINHDPDISLAAVGLWHVLVERNGETATDADVLAAQPNAMTWHPHAELEDISEPMNQLLAKGYIEQDSSGYNLRPRGSGGPDR